MITRVSAELDQDFILSIRGKYVGLEEFRERRLTISLSKRPNCEQPLVSTTAVVSGSLDNHETGNFFCAFNLQGFDAGRYLVEVHDASLGIRLASVETDLESLPRRDDIYRAKISVDQIVLDEDGTLIIAGEILNDSTFCWINCLEEPSNTLAIGGLLRLENKAALSESIETRTEIPVGRLRAGEAVKFKLVFDVQVTVPLTARLRIDLVRDPLFWVHESNPPFNLRLEFPYQPFQKEKFAVEVELTDTKWLTSKIVLINGYAANRGTLSLENGWDSETPYKIRVLAVDESNGKSYWCGSTRIMCDRIHPGDRIPFTVEVALPNPVMEGFLAEFAVVKEQRYWLRTRNTGNLKTFIHRGPEIVCKPSTDSRPKVYFLGGNPPYIDRDSTSQHQYKQMSLARKLGYHVTLLYDYHSAYADNHRYANLLQAEGFEVSDTPLKTIIHHPPQSPGIVIFCYYRIARYYLDLFREIAPRISTIINASDIHWLRLQRGVEQKILTYSQDDLTLLKEKEVQTYKRADYVWVVSDEDKTELLRIIPEVKARRIPLVYEKSPNYKPYRDKLGLIFVGNFYHTGNVFGAMWAAEVVKKVRSDIQQPISLHIVGSGAPAELKMLHDGDTICIRGHVQNLAEEYEQCRVALVPLQYGGGVKGKVCEAICHGVTVVTNDIGNEGIGLMHEQDGFIENTTEGLAAVVKAIFEDAYDLASINRRALEKILSENGPETVKGLISQSFDECLEDMARKDL